MEGFYKKKKYEITTKRKRLKFSFPDAKTAIESVVKKTAESEKRNVGKEL